jgi:hypothetical protein
VVETGGDPPSVLIADVPAQVDTVVIGAGVAGTAVAALLAATGRSVLVVERAPFVGGRAVSFVGRGDKVVADGVEMGPSEFRRALAHARTFVMLRTRFWGAGLLSAVIGMRRDVWADVGIDERSFVFLPDVLSDGFVGAVDLVMAVLGSWGRRNPEGHHDVCFSTALIDTEMRDRAEVREVVEWCETWVRATFADWDRDQELAIWTASPEAYGLWRPVGVDRPDVVSPHVDGLHFAGDRYGARLWGGGVDGAALSAVLCVDAMAGSDLEAAIFPWYHRGLVRPTVRR